MAEKILKAKKRRVALLREKSAIDINEKGTKTMTNAKGKSVAKKKIAANKVYTAIDHPVTISLLDASAIAFELGLACIACKKGKVRKDCEDCILSGPLYNLNAAIRKSAKDFKAMRGLLSSVEKELADKTSAKSKGVGKKVVSGKK